MKTRIGLVVLLAAGLALAASTPANAGGRWNFRIFASFVTAGGDATEDPRNPDRLQCLEFGECFNIDAQNGTAGGLSVEFRVLPHRFGIELGAHTGQLEYGVNVLQGLDPPGLFSDFNNFPYAFKTDFTPVFLAANYHALKKDGRVDFYVGLLYASIGYGKDVTTIGEQSFLFDVDDGDGPGLNMGFDVYVAKHWFVGGSLRYIRADSKVTISDPATQIPLFQGDLEIDPFLISFGGGARF